MPDMRRYDPEPFPDMPTVEHKPGLANKLLRELAPLLAEDGIDIDNLHATDPDTLRAAMNRAVERRNMQTFSPVGAARDHTITTLRLVTEAIAAGDTHRAAAILDSVPPEAPDQNSATVAGCIGVALGLLDEWLGEHDPQAPRGLAQQTRPPAGHWHGERAATDILALASKGRAFRSLDTLITRQGGQHVLYGAGLALTAITQAWAQHTDTPHPDLVRGVVR